MTATEEVKKPSVKKNSLLELKDFLGGLLGDERINQEDFNYVLNNRRSIEGRDKRILHYVADLKVKEGMLSLRLSGAQKIAAGITTVKEILRVTPDNRD
jgi:hypothetical protein|tara:strand:- start:653 stop:949 length:297 start_codon:yes stop_codon:yes gene_type:complete